MNDQTPTPSPQAAKPAISRADLLTMNKADAWFQRDWSAKPAAKFADLQALSTWELIKKHSL